MGGPLFQEWNRRGKPRVPDSGIAELPKQREFAYPVVYFDHGIFVFNVLKLFQRRYFMTFGKTCIFYQDSKCVLKSSFCDLNCNPTTYDKDISYGDEIDIMTKWRLEEEANEVGNRSWKSR
jgi:hypothetical protein